VRQHYLALLSVFASLPAMALTFQTRLENIEWKVEGDKFECRLTQPITDFGSGEFVRRAGEQATFRLKAYNGSLGAGSATLLAAAAPWQPGRGDINLGAVRAGSGDVLFNSSQAQAGRLFNGLLDGRSPTVRHYGREGGYSEIRLLPVKFNKAYSDYQLCTAKLLPMNYDQVKQTESGLPRWRHRAGRCGKAEAGGDSRIHEGGPYRQPYRIERPLGQQWQSSEQP